MFMRNLLLCLGLFTADASGDENFLPKFGQPASQVLLKTWNVDIFPDGEGLPPGQGHAREGEAVYREQCQSCHGVEGRGGSADELAGAAHTLTDDPPDKTIGTYWPYATTVFDFTRRTMPLTAPGSLSDAQVYAVTAYLLYLNGLIGKDDVINARTLPRVAMPNRNGFIDMSH
ncbi:MAG: cytochrome c [Methylomicrobium sp.]